MKHCIRHPLFKPAIRTVLALVLMLPLAFSTAYAQVRTGQLVVLDRLGGGKLAGAIYLVDPDSGNRSILSNFFNTAQGIRISSARNVAVDPSSGQIYTTSSGMPREPRPPEDLRTLTGSLLVRVNPLTGNRTAVSDLEDPAQGPVSKDLLEGLAVASNGQIYATAGKLLFRINPSTGARSIISDLGDLNNRPTVQRPDRILLESSEATLLILDLGSPRIVRLDLNTGLRSLVSAFGDSSQGVTGRNLVDFALEASGSILVTESFNLLLIRVDPITGNRTLVSDFENLEQGLAGRSIDGVTVNESGRIFVIDSRAGGTVLPNGAVFGVAPVTGQRTIDSDFGDNNEGPKGFKPTTVALAVEVSPTPKDLRLIRTVLLATERADIKKSAVVASGNVIANGSSGRALISKGATTPEGFEVAGDAVVIKKDAVVGGDVLVGNEFRNKGTILGMETIGDFPIFEALPPFNSAFTGDAKILVKKDGFLSLPAGRFQKIRVGKNATLLLEGGVYEAEALSVANGAEVFYETPVEIQVSKIAKFGKNSVFRPIKGSLLDAKSAVLYTGGNFKAGNGSKIQASIVGPNGVIQFGKSAALTGFAYGRTIRLGQSARAVLRNFLEDSIVEQQ